VGGHTTVKCLDCDAVFDPSPSGKGPRRQRCDFHRDLRKAQLQRARTAQLRAEGYGVVADLVIADDVFERDQWVCHLCGETVPEQLRVSAFRAGIYEPLAPVVDHVIPLSKGGPHTMDNCRLAHWTCNAQKHVAEGLDQSELEFEPPGDLQPHPVNPCKVGGCHREAQIKQMCDLHYKRALRSGDPLKMKCACGCGEIVTVSPAWTGLFYIDGHGVKGNSTEDTTEKFRRQLVAEPVSDRGRELYGLTDDCLLWTGTQANRGYGVINIRTGKRTTRGELVHRFAYELAFGEGSAAGLSVDHLCGVPLCCNPNHLEAVTLEENVRRAALAVTECPQGHPYDEQNTLYAGAKGYRICRQCNRNSYHLKELGHDFVLDPDNSSTKRQRCLTCRLERESTPQFCPYGHEYTPENTRLDTRGKRSCILCSLNRGHVEKTGHEYVIDPASPTKKRRCLICVETAAPITHCFHGHEYTALTLEFGPKGHRKCVQCRLNKEHVPQHGHEYVIDPNFDGKLRRCLICAKKKAEEQPTHCVHGHEYTPENTKYHKTRGNRICVTCQTNGFHIPMFGHEFVADPNHKGKLRRCLTCQQKT
jgi:hypothetical protein